MALIEDLKTKKYAYAALAVFVIVGGYFAVNAGIIDVVKSIFDVFFASAPVAPLAP